MNQNNNNPQVPPNAQPVPDQRLDQIMEQFRKMELQNAQLRGQIDMMTRQQNPNAPKPKEPAFKPEVQAAIDDAIEARLSQERARSQNQIGYLADQLDNANFQVKYGGEKYAKFTPKVESLRQEYQAQNKYITREQALQMVYFDETSKKGLTPDPAQPAAAPPAPVYDPYLRAYVDPVTAQPVQQPDFQAEEPQAPPPAQGWTPPNPQQQPPPQWGTTPPGTRMQPGAAHPNGNAYGQNFQLPGQGVNPPGPGNGAQSRGVQGPLSLESSDAQLEAFESKYGDIPL